MRNHSSPHSNRRLFLQTKFADLGGFENTSFANDEEIIKKLVCTAVISSADKRTLQIPTDPAFKLPNEPHCEDPRKVITINHLLYSNLMIPSSNFQFIFT